jgi:hypothetical protein
VLVPEQVVHNMPEHQQIFRSWQFDFYRRFQTRTSKRKIFHHFRNSEALSLSSSWWSLSKNESTEFQTTNKPINSLLLRNSKINACNFVMIIWSESNWKWV